MSAPVYLLVLTGLTLVTAMIAAARVTDAGIWRRSLIGYRLVLPMDLKPEQVATWLASIAALTHAPRGALLPSPPIVIEVRATAKGIEHRLYVPTSMSGAVLGSLRAALPGARTEALEQARAESAGPHVYAASLRLAGRMRQLAVDRVEATSRALLAGMQPLYGQELICWQWIATGAITPPPIATKTASGADSPLPWWLEGQAPADADEVRAARLKQREPLLHATGRLLISSGSRSRTYALFGRVWGPVRLLNVPGARLVRSLRSSPVARHQFELRSLPIFRWPLRLNAAELSGLVAFPLGDAPLPGVAVGASRQLPSDQRGRKGTVVALSNYPGSSEPLVITRNDRLMHVWLGGPTGVGKSTLMASMALQDAAYGDGFAMIDPKGDLVSDVLARVPEHRRDDVIVLDPADTARPVGFNVLAVAGSDADRELAVDHVLHVLREHWPAFWGPRTDMVLRLALMALTHSKAANGSAFTFCEIPELLTNQRFRRWVMEQPGLTDTVRAGLRWFDNLSDAERIQVIGPAMNKLSAFTHRTPLRLMLGQSRGLDLSAAMRDKKIVLVPLSRGRLGAETAGLIGSLLLTGLWQVALERVAISPERRRPFWYFVDEAQEIVRLPLEISDMLAEARGLHVGVTLANQHLAQLPEAVRRAVLSTVRSQIVFQVEPEDARVLARAFAPALGERDLRMLPAYEVAMRLCQHGQTGRPVTGTTQPLLEPVNDGEQLRRLSRDRYGTQRADVEESIRRRLEVQRGASSGDRPFGSRAVRGGDRP
jgi:hypothetical protein